ncbi:nitrilase-related carbon-nitrogen hydrolase [Nocardia sp. NBC_01327]|uniref:nitrilase-related carbon-nitrogen hydrolase n=1 Tax=Nocardia sp. NBC_01327 TaxID=2903593 RepID=UPI002E146128|nr:carbon-nitrogen hydrolase family protein [Nocardia sp. NBC_01327]
MRNTVRVAAVQAEPKWLRLSEGVEHVVELIGAAAAGGARLVAFPETFLPGYPWWRWVESNQWNVEYSTRCRENSMIRDGAEMRRITAAARDYGVQVVLGFGERQDRRIYMAQAVIDEMGQLISVRRKAGLNSVERKVFASGTPNLPTVHHSIIGKVGALTGQENQRPLLTRALRADEEQIHVAAWPGGLNGEAPGPDSSVTVSRMYALEAGAYVVAPCVVVADAAWAGRGGAPVVTRSGRARIYGADGTDVVTPLDEGAEGILFADLELDTTRTGDSESDLTLQHRLRKGGQQAPRATRAGSARRLGAERWAVPLTLGQYPGDTAAC